MVTDREDALKTVVKAAFTHQKALRAQWDAEGTNQFLPAHTTQRRQASTLTRERQNAMLAGNSGELVNRATAAGRKFSDIAATREQQQKRNAR